MVSGDRGSGLEMDDVDVVRNHVEGVSCPYCERSWWRAVGVRVALAVPSLVCFRHVLRGSYRDWVLRDLFRVVIVPKSLSTPTL